MRTVRLLHQQHREDPGADLQEEKDLQAVLHADELLHEEEEVLPQHKGQDQQLPPVHLQRGAVLVN